MNGHLGLPSMSYCVFKYKDPCYPDGNMPNTVMKNQEFNLNQSTFSCHDSKLSLTVSVCVYIRKVDVLFVGAGAVCVTHKINKEIESACGMI